MGSLKRSFFGYRRADVDAALSAQDNKILGLQSKLDAQLAAIDEYERETASLSGMVIEREGEIRSLTERLREANECHDRSIASLDAVTARLEEMQAQARGQATRIRMKALREAVEVSRRVQALTEAEEPIAPEATNPTEVVGPGVTTPTPNGNGHGEFADGIFAGQIKLEIGPLGDFSQLVGFEDAVGKLGASEISVERFSEGRATLSMRLEEPVELLRELEDLSTLEFKVRHTAPDNLILDVDEDPGPEQRAA
jgi:chromosome segregation ATPase